MHLYIANCTRSHWMLNVTVPERQKTLRLEIPSGHQREFPLDITGPSEEGVRRQLERLGAKDRKDIHGKLSDFTGLIYSTDKPLTEDEILAANEDQLDAAQNRSVAQATRSALAADIGTREGKKARGKRSVKSLGISVSKREDMRTGDIPMMDIEVADDGSARERLPI